MSNPIASIAKYIWTLRVPLFLLATIAVAPKMVALWILFVIAKPLAEFAYRKSPPAFKQRLNRLIPKSLARSDTVREINEGAEQTLPFVMFFIYLVFAPFAVGWIIYDWIRSFRSKPPSDEISVEDDAFVFKQNERRESGQQEWNFYHSKVFVITILAVFASGVPALFSWNLYSHLGVDKRAAETAFELLPINVKMPPPSSVAPAKDRPPFAEEVTAITGYYGYFPTARAFGAEPTKQSVFLIHFYLMSVACALSVLFFRAWFTFPLKFVSREHEVEFTEYGIKRKTFKGWMLNVMTLNGWATGEGPDSLQWSQVNSLRRMEEGFTRLYPLPDKAFKKESLTYKLLNKVAAFLDGLSRRVDTAEYLVFCKHAKGSLGDHIKINLKELSREQRARLYYSVRKWAPHVEVQPAAQQELLGSTVLSDYRYTQLWFDMLTSKVSRRTDLLNSEDALKEGKYKVVRRLSSGGQATAYLATGENDTPFVLKEFVLSSSTDDGATIESAREFEAEVSLLSQLCHPGVVRLEDFFFEQGRVYVVLEYVEGTSLKELVQKQGPLPEAEVKRIGEAVCDILEYMHTQAPPIVHRDVTPENLLIKDDGTIKLIDFSLAVKQDGKPVTESCGKQCFTPPEQFRDEVCPQSDLYALGATMYFLLTGMTPKPISTSSPRSKNANVSESMNAIVERATALYLTERYQSAHWLKLDLNAVSPSESSSVIKLNVLEMEPS